MPCNNIKPIDFKADEMEERNYNPNNLLLTVHDIHKKFEKIIVGTTRDTMKIIYEELSKRTRDQLMELTRSSFCNVMETNPDELLSLPQTDSKWIIFKDNVMIFYICRFMLLDKPIPVVVIDDSFI